MSKFIGRQPELDQLHTLMRKKSASFIIVKGRRRIGKSRLIEEFGKNFKHYYAFSGLPPEASITGQHQLDEFSRQLSREFQTARARYDDWSDALWALGERVQKGSTLVLFDEISWMGSKEPTFLAKIKNFWDQQLKKNDQLIFVICGSASSWIEKNILSSTGFVGRVSYTLTLDELPLPECNQFWPSDIAAYEKFKLLSITGGIPKYLEEILPAHCAEDNIMRLCFTKGGFLVDEFEQMFSDIFLRKTLFYKQIIETLLDGAKEQGEIAACLKIKWHGRIPEYLHELMLAGLISQDHSWNIRTGQDSNMRKYRLSDNYLRFYLKYIEKNLSKINRKAFSLKSVASLTGWENMLGLQFENLILNNRKTIHQALNLNPDTIICDNPYFQRETLRHQSCQIDYMIQTKFDTLFVCEIKFSRRPIGCSVIDEVQDKINRLKRPKGFSCRPILIHVNGVTEELVDRDYFSSIIDMCEFLQK